MDVLCCDKTGTLTRDKIVLERHLDVLGAPSDRVLRHAYLNSVVQTGRRPLMDEAILERAARLAAGGRSMDARAGEAGVRTSPEAATIAGARDHWRLVDEIPFDFDRRRMSVVVEDAAGKRQLITKGAVEEMIDVCSTVEVGTEVLPLTDERADQILDRVRGLNERGMRVVGVAQRNEMIDVCSTVEVGTEVLPLTDERADQILDRVRGLNERGMRVVGVAQRNDVPARDLTADDEHDMTLIGYLAFLDPPKASAKAAVKELGDLGVAVKVLTGDNAAVAATVCEQVGIDARNMLTGADVDLLSDDELAERAERAGLFAKLSPLQKARIVEVLRTHGKHTVGFMGDGINDAPALVRADVGMAMGTGTDVAMESADITLMHGSPMAVVTAWDLSRATMRNIRENLGFALGYNGLGIPVAAGVLYPAWHILLSPMIAGAAMAFSSLSVVLNANRLHAFDPTCAKPRHTTGRLAPVTIDEQALAKPAADNTATTKGHTMNDVLGIPVAAGVLYPAWHILLSPMIAGAAMAFSSLSVVLNANRLHAFDPTCAKPRHTTGRLAPVTIDEQALAKPAADNTATTKGHTMNDVHEAIDPVCGMVVDPEHAADTRVFHGKTIYFCNPHCAAWSSIRSTRRTRASSTAKPSISATPIAPRSLIRTPRSTRTRRERHGRA